MTEHQHGPLEELIELQKLINALRSRLVNANSLYSKNPRQGALAALWDVLEFLDVLKIGLAKSPLENLASALAELETSKAKHPIFEVKRRRQRPRVTPGELRFRGMISAAVEAYYLSGEKVPQACEKVAARLQSKGVKDVNGGQLEDWREHAMGKFGAKSSDGYVYHQTIVDYGLDDKTEAPPDRPIHLARELIDAAIRIRPKFLD